MPRPLLAILLSAALVCGCGAPPSTDPPADPATLTEPEREALALAEAGMRWPEDGDLPVPPDGWYTLELGGDTIKVFRDNYGVPHVFAPSIRAAFRGQGYVILEDRCIQVLHSREAAIGRRSERVGEGTLGFDGGVRSRLYSDDDLQAMWDGLPEDTRAYLGDWLDGANAYLAEHVPYVPRFTERDVVAGGVLFLGWLGNTGDTEYETLKLVAMLSTLKGKEFAEAFLHDCMPPNISNAVTTDHSLPHTMPEQNLARRTGADVDYREVAALLAEEDAARRFVEPEGLSTRWGSMAWTLSPEHSATGNPLVFASPMPGFSIPAKLAQIHLVAPGLNVSGICYPGIPGVVIGHSEHTAWGLTAGFVNQDDIFAERLNPENKRQYWHNGEWRDMEVRESFIAVRTRDEKGFRLVPHEALSTVHGPVIRMSEYNNQAFALQRAHARLEVQSFTSFINFNLARTVYDIQAATRDIAVSLNVVCADSEGNIGFFLSGRLPDRHPDQDPRLLTPGDGGREWRGVANATDLVSSINPPEGWFVNFNGKPSTKVEGWWPEVLWSRPVNELFMTRDTIDWDTFKGLNQVSGEYHFGGDLHTYYLLDLLRERAAGNPTYDQAIAMLEAWEGNDTPGSPAAYLFNEWVLDLMIEVLAPDFGPMVKRTMKRSNIQLFGPILYRVMMPERSGIEIRGDYLHGRDRNDLAWAVFEGAFDRIVAEHGPDMTVWPYEPELKKMGRGETMFGYMPRRNTGMFWGVTELGPRVRHLSMLVPGQSGLEQSPHAGDQLDLFVDWQYRENPFYPEDFPPFLDEAE